MKMDENNLEKKMDSCRWYGTPQCPHRSEMKNVFIPEKPEGTKIQYRPHHVSLENAQFCKDCEKYEKG